MMRAAPRAAGAYPRRPGQFAASVRIDRSVPGILVELRKPEGGAVPQSFVISITRTAGGKPAAFRIDRCAIQPEPPAPAPARREPRAALYWNNAVPRARASSDTPVCTALYRDSYIAS